MFSVTNLLASPLDKLSLVNAVGFQTSDLTLLSRASIPPITLEDWRCTHTQDGLHGFNKRGDKRCGI